MIKESKQIYVSKVFLESAIAKQLYCYCKYNIEINKFKNADDINKKILAGMVLENMAAIFIQTDTDFKEWAVQNKEQLKKIKISDFFLK